MIAFLRFPATLMFIFGDIFRTTTVQSFLNISSGFHQFVVIPGFFDRFHNCIITDVSYNYACNFEKNCESEGNDVAATNGFLFATNCEETDHGECHNNKEKVNDDFGF